MSLYQIIADQFYPERADFTVTRNVGQELADLLVDSYPILVRRDLGDSLSSMLRDGEWFEMGIMGKDDPDHEGKKWLEWATGRLRSLFNERRSNFVRATKEGDHDFITFGSTCISIELNKDKTGLLFRCWHLRDVSWWDGVDGQVEGTVRTWKPTYQQYIDYFGDRASGKAKESEGKDRFKRGHLKHLVMPSHMYGEDEFKQYPFVSIYLDMEEDQVVEAVGLNNKMYVIPRFKTIPGSQFAYSPATTVGLPDARTIQEMQHTLLEASERYARPPIIATQKVIRGDIDLSPDGITYVEKEYDEKLGASLRTLPQDRGGWPIGREMRDGIVNTLKSAFYTNKLTLPDVSHEMTAYEVSERMKQYRRENLPLFEPIEVDYSGQMCELGFEVARDGGLLGSPYDVPQSLQEADVEFTFISPLSELVEEKKASQFKEVVGMVAQASEIDPNAVMNVDMDEALRDAMSGTGAPETWKRDPEEVKQGRQVAALIEAKQVAAEANG